MFSVHTKTQSRRFWIPSVWRAFSWRISVDGSLGRSAGLLDFSIRAVFIWVSIWVSKSNWFLHFLRHTTGLKNSRHFFIQSEVKPKPIMTHSHAFTRTFCQLHVITSSFDWFTGLSVSVSSVIGWSNYFGFGFTTRNWKPLYLWYKM